MKLSASNTKSLYFGIGRRKNAVAKVILIPGTGSMVVNHKPGELYLQFNSQYNMCMVYGMTKQVDFIYSQKGFLPIIFSFFSVTSSLIKTDFELFHWSREKALIRSPMPKVSKWFH